MALEKIQALPALRQMPADVRMQSAGDAEIMEELFASFGQAMLAGMLPIALQLGYDTAFRAPMAIAVMGD